MSTAHRATRVMGLGSLSIMTYEILYIIPSRYSDTEIEGIVKQVEEGLVKNGAKVEKTENLGKIKMAYPIKKERYGTYILTYVDVEGESVQKIDGELRLTDEVLRHVIVKREDGIPKEEFRLEQYEAPITAEGKRIHKKSKTEVPKRKQVPSSSDEKISKEEIDKKLDSILEDDDLGNV